MIGSATAPGVWSSLFLLALIAALAIYSWRRRRLPGAAPFAVACALAALWVGAVIGEGQATDLAVKVAWYKIQVICQVPTITAIAGFIVDYAWPGRWLTKRNLLLLSIAPALMAIMILTNERHHLMWRSLTAEGVIAPVAGPLNAFLVVYAIVFAGMQLGALVWLLVRSPVHRWPGAIMLAGVVFNRVVYVLNAANHPLEKYLPSDVVLIGIASLVFAVALFGFRILDPIAQARSIAADQMSDGMLVVDAQGRVVSINRAAQVMLGIAARRALGRPVSDLLPAECGFDRPLSDDGEHTTECVLAPGPAQRQVVITCSGLKDWRGVVSGRLLLLRDVTAERAAQAQVLEQQRSLATLRERERLARELHDSLGQTLAAAQLQVGTAKLMLDQGKLSETERYLANLGEITLAAEVDVREYILGARTLYAGGASFFDALRQYVERFGRLYELRTELIVPGELEARGFGLAVETQLLRIVQEALSNVRKHARARSCRIEFAALDNVLRVVVTDDGRGFDALAVTSRQGDGYGLRTMRERTESLGGTFAVDSAPGRGTRVKVEVPSESLTITQTEGGQQSDR